MTERFGDSESVARVMAENRRLIGEKTSAATRWSALAEIAAKLISPVSSMILARLLSPEAFGVVATVNMVVSFADIFSDAGFQKYLVQRDFRDSESLYKSATVAFWTNIAISCILWFAIFVFRDGLAVLVGSPGLGSVIAVASLSLPLTSFSSIQMSLFRREFDFKALFRVRVLVALVPLVVTAPLALLTRSYWALVVGTLCGNLFSAALLTVASQWKPTLYFSVELLREMFSYSWWILLESIAVWATSYLDTLIVGSNLNSWYLGLYKTSMVTVNSVLSLITSATSSPLFSALSRLKHDSGQLVGTYLDYVRAIGVCVVPLGFGIWLYRDVVVAVLLGGQWAAAEDFVGAWGLMGSVSLVLGTYCNGLYNAIGKTRLSFFSQVLHLAVLVPTVYLASCSGYEALCIARSLVRLQLVIVQVLFMWIFVGISPWESINRLLPIFGSSFVMSVFSLVIDSFLPRQISCAIGIPGCAAIYFLVLHLLSRGLVVDSLSLLGVLQPAERKRA